MEAKDTVMSDEQIAQYMNTPEAHAGGDDCYWDLDGIAEAQAEITWDIAYKAGMETGNQKAYEIGVEDGKVEGVAKGIREVVKWLQENCRYQIEAGINGRELATFVVEKWQAKLKEWGIKEGE